MMIFRVLLSIGLLAAITTARAAVLEEVFELPVTVKTIYDQAHTQWFEAFVAAGGQGTFAELPAFKNDGHASFAGNRPAWAPAFEAFLKKNGF